MTNQQKEQITAMRSQGFGYATIAKAVGLQKGTVVAYCRKNRTDWYKRSGQSPYRCGYQFLPEVRFVTYPDTRRKRIKFCSDKCRVTRWNAHPETSANLNHRERRNVSGHRPPNLKRHIAAGDPPPAAKKFALKKLTNYCQHSFQHFFQSAVKKKSYNRLKRLWDLIFIYLSSRNITFLSCAVIAE